VELSSMDSMQAASKAGATSVLIVDAEPQVARVMLQILARRGIRAHIVEDRRAALEFVDRCECDLVFVSFAAVSGQGGPPGRLVDPHTIRQLRTNQPELPVIVTAGIEDLGTGLGGPAGRDVPADTLLRLTAQVVHDAAEAGANGFLMKPLDRDQVGQVLDRFLPARRICRLASAAEASHSLYQIVGRSQQMIQVMELARRIAPTSAPVLISGESGTGKELLAYLIHHKSRRSLGPYVKVNCAALSDSLLESELFGHEKGAFTGALMQHKGRFERAHEGTLLLDEITETPPSFQAKLLRILEHQELERVGGQEAIQVNVRLISTTNKDLLEEVRCGRFRQDLYYRLSAMRLKIPPLRDRLEDLGELVWHFVNEYARESQRAIAALDPVMMDIFHRYDWPGNVRQLRNVVRTCLILGTGPALTLADVSWLMDGAGPCVHPARAHGNEPVDLGAAVREPLLHRSVEGPCGLGGLPLEVIERRAIMETLERTSGNRKKAAEVLGISDRTLRERIRRYKQQPALQPA
jgi:DNA-binding NtrC family response regulator